MKGILAQKLNEAKECAACHVSFAHPWNGCPFKSKVAAPTMDAKQTPPPTPRKTPNAPKKSRTVRRRAFRRLNFDEIATVKKEQSERREWRERERSDDEDETRTR